MCFHFGRGRRTRTLGTRFWSAIFNFLLFFAISNNRIGKTFLTLLIFVTSRNFCRPQARTDGKWTASRGAKKQPYFIVQKLLYIMLEFIHNLLLLCGKYRSMFMRGVCISFLFSFRLYILTTAVLLLWRGSCTHKTTTPYTRQNKRNQPPIPVVSS